MAKMIAGAILGIFGGWMFFGQLFHWGVALSAILGIVLIHVAAQYLILFIFGAGVWAIGRLLLDYFL